MSKDFEILLNEYKELSKQRERNIPITGQITQTYLTFIGFSAAALAILFNAEINNKILAVYFILFILLINIIVGIFSYSLLIQAYINKFFYTNGLNRTRSYIIEMATEKGFKNKIFLPINDIEPGNLGHLEKSVLEHGYVGMFRKINSFLITAKVYIFFNIDKVINQNNQTNDQYELVRFFLLMLFVFIPSYYFHNYYYKKVIERARDKWKKEINERSICLLNKG